MKMIHQAVHERGQRHGVGLTPESGLACELIRGFLDFTKRLWLQCHSGSPCLEVQFASIPFANRYEGLPWRP
jgi:hypothetical protein